MNTAIYPGTFDPITFGHIDVIKKSINIFDRVVVATTDNINKHYHFSINERLSNISLLYDILTGCSLFSIISMSVFTIDLYFSMCFKTGITLFILGFL